MYPLKSWGYASQNLKPWWGHGGAEVCGPGPTASNSNLHPPSNPHNPGLFCGPGNMYVLPHNAKFYLPLSDIQIPGAPEGALGISLGSTKDTELVGDMD